MTCNLESIILISACPESRPEWMELSGGGGAVCYAPSRLGKLVLRITGFPRVTQQCHQTQQQGDSHHRETRHLYLGFHHPWDRDLWKSWIKQVSQTRVINVTTKTSFITAITHRDISFDPVSKGKKNDIYRVENEVVVFFKRYIDFRRR